MKRRNNQWVNKMLKSYIPIFFFVISSFFLIFFFVVQKQSEQSAIRTTAMFGEQFMHSVDASLLAVDQLISKEMFTDNEFVEFIRSSEFSPYMIFELSKKLNQMKISFPLIHSLYIYNKAADYVISSNAAADAHKFPDYNFMMQQFDSEKGKMWSGRRTYTHKDGETEVVSLVHKIPFLTGKDGLIVVNVSIQALQQFIENMIGTTSNYVEIYDKQQKLIISSSKENKSGGKILASHESEYTNWNVQSGWDNGRAFSFIHSISQVWIIFAVLTIVLGTLWLVYVTRRNYKPIESILARINHVVEEKMVDIIGKDHVNADEDELRFIESTVQNLLHEYSTIRSRQEEDSAQLQHYLFLEVIEGHRTLSQKDWQAEMTRLGITFHHSYMLFAMLEIDKYSSFSSAYNKQDQYLLKFVLSNVMNEMAQKYNICTWTEWISISKMGILFSFEEQSEEVFDQVLDVMEQSMHWFQKNIDFTVTVALGGATSQLEDISELYDDALEALQYKSVVGVGQILDHRHLNFNSSKDLFKYTRSIQTIADLYRLSSSDWEEQWELLFVNIRKEFPPREEILNLLNHLLLSIDREVMELATDIQQVWQERAMPELTTILSQYESLQEFQTEAFKLLENVQHQLQSLKANKVNNQLILDAQTYITSNYADANLSLTQLSEQFHLSSRYLSRLFKEELGEKFIDYVMKIRIEHAQRLLNETNLSVQEIAQQVGYTHSISFIRAFKKIVGLTPGEYRKE
ncbi:helix-turn-helix domain-containing protein [Paenibacillus yanchengensis]|uniref:Helix-turn-helix domain-containing protein n=1 Tax=Paenibacillus yanchengensis TaxID=2035833 RepID=A0ABW4YNJ6_9BACL